jgi:hypothetical protein
MSKITKFILFSALLCLAMLFYFMGSAKGAIAFILMGFLLELGFWIGIFKTTKRKS